MKIITLTLNPAYDVHVKIGRFLAGHENLAESVSRDIGGKGVNISRALVRNPKRLHAEHRSLVVLGEENSDDFTKNLRSEKISFDEIRVRGRIRENITIHPDEGDETRLSFKGFTAPAGFLRKVLEKLDVKRGDIVTFTGSVPGGVGAEETDAFLSELKKLGVRLVIDSKSVSADSLIKLKPWLIKPNAEELSGFAKDGEAPETTARRLSADGIENVMISLGGDGALLASDGELYRSKNPKIDAVSTIGAGDSSIAGFISAFTRGESPENRLREATAFGTAACLTEGTNPPRAEDVERIYEKVIVDAL